MLWKANNIGAATAKRWQHPSALNSFHHWLNLLTIPIAKRAGIGSIDLTDVTVSETADGSVSDLYHGYSRSVLLPPFLSRLCEQCGCDSCEEDQTTITLTPALSTHAIGAAAAVGALPSPTAAGPAALAAGPSGISSAAGAMGAAGATPAGGIVSVEGKAFSVLPSSCERDSSAAAAFTNVYESGFWGERKWRWNERPSAAVTAAVAAPAAPTAAAATAAATLLLPLT